MKKLYVLIRSDLTPSYRAVQGGHALAEFILRHPTQAKEWDNHTLIYLQVDDEESLKLWADKLKYRDIPYEIFREPDIENEVTALACYCDGRLFSNLKLLKDE